MKLVVFGLTVSSSWGNGHATLWRGLIKALTRRGHRVVFYEKDVPYYASQRDSFELPPGGELRLYTAFDSIRREAERELRDADLGMVTSYCPDGRAACALVLNSPARVRSFYDLDTPVTLADLKSGKEVDYLPKEGLGGFDIVFSYTGGRALTELQSLLGARLVAPLYGSVDPESHFPVQQREEYRCDLSYLGTYAADRQPALDELFLKPARERGDLRFLIGGALYPPEFAWSENIFFKRHMPPRAHPAFFSSSRITLNVTRKAMADYGYCPSGRLFEAAACGTPIVSDGWEGLEQFFEPNSEILCARNAQDVLAALSLADDELRRMEKKARERVLTEHTAEKRVQYLEQAIETIGSSALAS